MGAESVLLQRPAIVMYHWLHGSGSTLLTATRFVSENYTTYQPLQICTPLTITKNCTKHKPVSG